jgi:uncharacterized delta-60 repeat protein
MAFRSSSRSHSPRAATPGVVLATLLLVAFAPARALAAPGDLDPTFSGDGKAQLPQAGNGSPTSIAVQPDGKVVMAGSPGFVLNRVGADGAPDRSFGDDGVVTTEFPGGASAYAVALQPDGRIVAAGEANGRFALARYLPDGRLDDSFSGDGRAVTDLSGYIDALAVQPDGRVVGAGLGIGAGFALARFNPDGSLDDSFSGDGKLLLHLRGGGLARGLALAPDGGIVVAGSSSDAGPPPDDRIAVARLKPDGTPDPLFSGDGILTARYAPNGDGARDVIVQPDGRIVTAGFGFVPVQGGDERAKFELVRFMPDGKLDPTFSGGIVRTRIRGDAYGWALALQPDGKIVAAGESGDDFALARYNGDGTRDHHFSGDGRLVTSFSKPPHDYKSTLATDVALGPDGKIVAGGPRQFGGRWVLSRYNASAGPGDADADADGVRDARDLCPPRFGQHDDGCPHFRRSLTIRFAPEFDEFRGELTGGGFICEAERVVLVRRRPGRDRLVDSVRTRPDGRWEISRFRPQGQFYAHVKRHVHPSYGICAATRSDVLDLG